MSNEEPPPESLPPPLPPRSRPAPPPEGTIRPPGSPPLPKEKVMNLSLKGLGGWLVLVAIGFIFTVCRVSYVLLTVYPPLFAPAEWALLTHPDSPYYHPLMGPLIMGEVTVNSLIVLMAIVLLVSFFKKKRWFPRLMIIYLALDLVFVIADHILTGSIPLLAHMDRTKGEWAIVRAVGHCCIWIPYFIVSDRVKLTFVE